MNEWIYLNSGMLVFMDIVDSMAVSFTACKAYSSPELHVPQAAGKWIAHSSISKMPLYCMFYVYSECTCAQTVGYL